MERNGDDFIAVTGENPAALAVADAEVDGKAQASALSSTLFLDHVGQVILTSNSDGLSWSLVQSFNNVASLSLSQ